jgi:hypothetical protein
LSGGVGQLAGSVIEKPHGLHFHTYKLSAKPRLISCNKVIGRPQTGQIVSVSGVMFCVTLDLCGVPRPSIAVDQG